MTALTIGGSGTASLFKPVIMRRAPTENDKIGPSGKPFIQGQPWADVSSSPAIIYFYAGGGQWRGNIITDDTLATGTDNNLASALAVKTYVDGVAIAGAPDATTVTKGIVYLAEDDDVVTPYVADFPNTAIQPSNITPMFSSPPPIGDTSPSTGAFTALTSAGVGAAFSLTSDTASSVGVTGAGIDLTLSSDAGRVIVNAEEAAANAITLVSAAGGLDVDVALLASITSTRNNAQAILLEATAGGVDILASGASAGEDIDIVATGSSVNISATENAADSITITSTAGGIDITAAGAATEDIDIVNTAGSIVINAGEAVSDAINIDTAGGVDLDAAGQINLRSTQSAADSIVIESTVGGIDILASGAAAGEDIDIIATGSSINLSATENAALAITLNTNGGTSETIRVRNQQGTSAASIELVSTAGGLTLTGGLGTADAINLVTSAAGGGIDIDSGTAGFIVDTTGAFSLDGAAASNMSVTGAGIDVTVASASGSINLTAGEAAADAVNVDSTGGFDLDAALQINLTSSQVAATAVRILASDAAGGIDIDSGTGGITIDSTGAFSIDGAAASNVTTTGAGIDLTLSSVLGSVLVSSTEDAALAIRLHANGGTSETIQIHSDQGTGVSSVGLLSDVGGITLRATGLASADAINLEAAAGGIDVDAALQINVRSTQNAADSIVIESTVGGIDILASGAGAGEDIDIIATGSSINITATESAADAIVLTASGAAGGITLDPGTGGVNVAGNFSLTDVATKISMNGGAVTDFIGTATLVAGTVTVANTNIAAGDRIMISRTALNASPALGHLIYTISAGASFTVDSYTDAGAAAVTDVSSFSYVIFRQT